MERLLRGCYEESLKLAVEHGCRSVAFPGISTGIYGYPHGKAVPIALDTVRRFLEGGQGGEIELVVFVAFTGRDQAAYDKFLP